MLFSTAKIAQLRIELNGKPNDPILTISKLLNVWSNIQSFFWFVPLRFHVLQDLMLSTLLPVRNDISYNIIPPSWFKYIPNRRELPLISSDIPDSLLYEWTKVNKEYAKKPKVYTSTSERSKIIKELVEKLKQLQKKLFAEKIELLKKQFPNQYETINQMVEKGESFEVIESFVKLKGSEVILTKIDEKDKKTISSGPEKLKPEQLPDPSTSTSLNYWTTDKLNVLKISTYTNDNDKPDGIVSFKLNRSGNMTKQRALMELLLESKCITVGEIIKSCYRDEMAERLALTTILKRVRSLISGIRIKKLKNNGINPDIITPLGHDIERNNKVYLKIRKVNHLDDKHFESKSINSYKPPDEISSDSNEQIDDFANYDADKYLDDIDDEIIN